MSVQATVFLLQAVLAADNLPPRWAFATHDVVSTGFRGSSSGGTNSEKYSRLCISVTPTLHPKLNPKLNPEPEKYALCGSIQHMHQGTDF
jgi:hypothetical protein